MINSCRDALYERLFFKDIDFEIMRRPYRLKTFETRRRACSTSLQKFIKFFTTIKPGDARIGRLYNLLNGCFNKLLYFNLLINGIHTSSWIRFFEDFDEKTG